MGVDTEPAVRAGWPGAIGRRRALLPAIAVTTLQVGGCLATSQHHQPGRAGLDGWAIALLAGSGLALAARERCPVAVLGVTGAATAVYFGAGYAYGPAVVAFAWAMIVAVLRGHRAASWMIVITAFVAFLGLDRVVSGTWMDGITALDHLIWLVTVVGVAELARAQRERVVEIRRRRVAEARRRSGEERLRLARELHDVLAHHVSLINVQSSTALHLFDEDPQRARTALAAIKAASHQTLQELRATVGALRADGEIAPRAPAAGLAEIDDLAAQSASTGVRVEVRRTGLVGALPPRVDLAAYRVVQEALTNVRRHSGSSTATVGLHYGSTELDICVRDHGRGAPAQFVAGHGLQGMRERVEALGGVLAAATVDGGFEVVAHLPLDADGRDTIDRSGTERRAVDR